MKAHEQIAENEMLPTKGKGALSRRVLKVMGMFAGLQSANIICSIAKMKLVSIWLGTVGVALFGILTNAQETIATFTDLGLRQSTVRDVASEAGNPPRLAWVAMLVRKWSVLAGLLGASVMILLSPALGEWFFDDFRGCLPFALVGVAMFFNCLLYGEQSLLQGSGRLKALARGSLFGTVVGLAASVPMFRWMGDISIPLSFIVYSVAIWGFTLYFRYRPSEKVKSPGLKALWNEGKGFVRLGILMSLATFVTSVSRLVFIALLTRFASLNMTGLFQAGDTLVTRYFGVIFTAIGMEFLPRIVSTINSRTRTSAYLNHEVTLLLTVATPIALLFILSRGVVVELLYSSEFMPILTFMSLAVAGTVLKSLSWCLGICIIARGDGKLYLMTEGTDALLSLILLTLGYRLGGLAGLGWAYVAWNVVYTLIVWAACRFRYGITPAIRTSLFAMGSVLLCLLACLTMDTFPLWVNALIVIPIVFLFILPLRKLLH